MASERQFQQALYKQVVACPCVRDGGHSVGMEVSVPYKHVYMPGVPPVLEVWCFKQDIAIYDTLLPTSVPYRGAQIVEAGTPYVKVTLEKDNAQHTAPVALPYVLVETKAKQPNSHDLLAYSQKTEMIKTIFPYVKCILVVFGNISPRTYRHGLQFDEVVCMNLSSRRDKTGFCRLLCRLLQESKRDIARLSGGASCGPALA